MQRQTDGDEMVKFFGTATRDFLMRSFVVLERRRQLSFLALLQVALAAVTILQWQIMKGLWPSSCSEPGGAGYCRLRESNLTEMIAMCV